jgi:PIN domain nuclease of toxin-antitoxin system
MTYVADTHAFLWWLAQDARLGQQATAAFEAAEEGRANIIVPTIVLAESVRVVEKKRLTLRFEDVLRRLETGWNYTAYPLDMAVVLQLPRLNKLRELHDRIIVATAKALGATLITRDAAIRESGYVTVVW